MPPKKVAYKPTARKDDKDRKIYTKDGKDYVKRKKTDGTFKMTPVTKKKATAKATATKKKTVKKMMGGNESEYDFMGILYGPNGVEYYVWSPRKTPSTFGLYLNGHAVKDKEANEVMSHLYDTIGQPHSYIVQKNEWMFIRHHDVEHDQNIVNSAIQTHKDKSQFQKKIEGTSDFNRFGGRMRR
jgi:hypothetical protein